MRDFHRPGRSTVHAANGMAATSHPQASLAAIDVLRAGGTAADAAVTAAALLGVIEPQSTGIGGDGFALYAPGGSDRIAAYNGSGAAPQAASAAFFLDRKMTAIPLTGAHAVTVPGNVDLWATLLEAHGRKGLDAALAPAIRAAEAGYAVAPRIAWDWARNADKLRAGINTARFLLPAGRAPQPGDVIRQGELAATLRLIAQHGRDAFYRGRVADDIVSTLRGAGGLHTLDDFAAHRTEQVVPIFTPYRGCEVWECPPNGPGITVLMMLNLLAAFELGRYGPMSVERFHLEAEATRHAYLMREGTLGDPRLVDVDVKKLLSHDLAAETAARIRLDRAGDLEVARPPMNPHTVYLCVVDRDRNACSLINSIAYAFGAAVMAPGSGVLLNNRGAGFRVEPGHPNAIAPGKRPLHTLIPGLMTKNGRTIMPFGVMGGQYQPVGHVHLVTNILDYGLDVQEAIDLPRGLHYEGVYGLEAGVPDAVARGLAGLGHAIARVEEPHGGAQAIMIDWQRGVLVGGSDPRKDGCALGY